MTLLHDGLASTQEGFRKRPILDFDIYSWTRICLCVSDRDLANAVCRQQHGGKEKGSEMPDAPELVPNPEPRQLNKQHQFESYRVEL